MYPVAAAPSRGVFAARQMAAVGRLLRHPVQVVLVGPTGVGGVLASRRAVAEAIQAHRPDVIHVYYGLSGAAVPLFVSVPIVLTLCGSDVFQWTIGRTVRGLLEYAVSLTIAARSALILVQSNPVQRALPSEHLRAKVRVVPTGIDTTAFRPMDQRTCRRRLGWPLQEKVVLFPAAPERPLKRFSLAEAAVAEASVAEGAPARLRTMIGVAPADVPMYLNAADVVVVTSKWEAGPVVAAEALACGVPVVTVPVGYAAEEVQPTRWLRVVTATPRSLGSAIAEYLNAPVPHERPGDLKITTAEEYAEQLLGVYDVATGGRASATPDPVRSHQRTGL